MTSGNRNVGRIYLQNGKDLIGGTNLREMTVKANFTTLSSVSRHDTVPTI